MAIVKRLVKGSALTHSELDGNFSELEGRVGGFSLSPNKGMNRDFMVFTTGILRPTNAFSHGTVINWEILQDATHGSLFYKSASGDSTQQLNLYYPPVKTVLFSSVTNDETFAAEGVCVGASVGTDKTVIKAIKRGNPPGVKLTGDGAGGWTKSPQWGSFVNVTTYSTGSALAIVENSALESPATYHDGVNISYVGANNYRVRRVFSGLPGGYSMKFILVDNSTGADVTTAPTTSDIILVQNIGTFINNVALNTYTNGSSDFMGTFTNFWVAGLFEAWMIASPVSSTEVQVKWQDYPSATSYKLYRDVNEDFSTQTLIYEGSLKEFRDSGLTTATTYNYKLLAVVSGADTEVTTFKAVTK